MLYSHTCGHCMKTIPKVEALALAGQSIALLSMPPHTERNRGYSVGATGQLNNAREWFAQTPVLVELRDGIVIRAANGPEADDWF